MTARPVIPSLYPKASAAENTPATAQAKPKDNVLCERFMEAIYHGRARRASRLRSARDGRTKVARSGDDPLCPSPTMALRSQRSLARGAWLVTGAASGFGREFVRQLVARGERVVLWDRDINGLDATCAVAGCPQAHREVVDVVDDGAVRAAATRSALVAGPIAHVVHCAGILRVGPAERVGSGDYRAMLEVNALGSIHVGLATLPLLREAARGGGRGTLMFVASVAGLRGFPELAGYCASKHAVLGFAQSLRDELEDEPVDVKVLCPPPGDTPMVRDLPRKPPIYKLSKLYSAEQIVEAALADFESSAWVTLVDLGSKALWRVARFAPAVLDRVVSIARRDRG